MTIFQELKSMRTPPLLPDSIMARFRPNPRTGSDWLQWLAKGWSWQKRWIWIWLFCHFLRQQKLYELWSNSVLIPVFYLLRGLVCFLQVVPYLPSAQLYHTVKWSTNHMTACSTDLIQKFQVNGNIQIAPPTVTACHCVLCTGSTAVVLWKPPPPSGSILPDLVIFVFFNHLYFTNRLYTLITCQVSSALRNSEQRAPGCGRHRTRCYSEVNHNEKWPKCGEWIFLNYNVFTKGYQHPVFQSWEPQLLRRRHAWPFPCRGLKSWRKKTFI